MIVNKYRAIIEWMKDYVQIGKWIYFNVTLAENNIMSVTSVQSQRTLEEYIDGSKRVEFLFGIALCKTFDNGTSDVNLEAMQEYENIASWIEEQNDNENYPDFGENIVIEEVEVLETAPSLTVDNQNGIARYQGQYRITYMEEENNGR